MRRRWIVIGVVTLLGGAAVAILKPTEPNLLDPYRAHADRGYTNYTTAYHRTFKEDFVVVPAKVKTVMDELRPKLEQAGWKPDVRTGPSWGRYMRLRHNGPDEFKISGFRYGGQDFTRIRATYRLGTLEQMVARVRPYQTMWKKGP